MKRLIKKYSSHDYNNRDMALAILDGVVYVNTTHTMCVNDHLSNNNKDTIPGSDFLRPTDNQINRSTESYLFGHIVSYQTMIKDIKFNREDFDDKNWNYITQGWQPNEIRVFIEYENSNGIDIYDAIDILNNQLPNLGYSNFTIWEDTANDEYCDDIHGNEVEYDSYSTWGNQ